MEHLVFVWNSADMNVSLPQVKTDKIIDRGKAIVEEGGCMAADLRSLLGTLENVRMATILAALHYRGLQYLLPRPGQRQIFSVKAWLKLNQAAQDNLLWWAYGFPSSHTSTSLTAWSVTLEVWTDASGLVGWSGHCSRGR